MRWRSIFIAVASWCTTRLARPRKATAKVIAGYCPECGGAELVEQISDRRVSCPQCEPVRR